MVFLVATLTRKGTKRFRREWCGGLPPPLLSTNRTDPAPNLDVLCFVVANERPGNTSGVAVTTRPRTCFVQGKPFRMPVTREGLEVKGYRDTLNRDMQHPPHRSTVRFRVEHTDTLRTRTSTGLHALHE